MYQVGDRVVHPCTGRDHRKYRAGTAGRTAGQLLRVPNALRRADAEDPHRQLRGHGVRALSTSGRIREVLSAIPGLEIDRTTNWNRRYRENLNRLKSGDLLEVARVIKGLMWRDREKGLSNGERKMLHSAKQILVSEVVLVEGHTYPDAEQRIEQAMMTGAKNE